MITLTRSLVIVSILITFGPSIAWAGSVTIPHRFEANTPAVAAQMNENFDAVKDAVESNASGVNWDQGYLGDISTDENTVNVASVALTAPTDGFVIVTASGSIWWQPEFTNMGEIYVKVSTTDNDIGHGPGFLYISRKFPEVATMDIPYSVSIVFPVIQGTINFYLNMLHNTVNGIATAEYYTLVAIFVPNKY